MYQAKICGYKTKGLRGGAISNIRQLEKDFVAAMTFGKQEAPKKMSSQEIKKKFSI